MKVRVMDIEIGTAIIWNGKRRIVENIHGYKMKTGKKFTAYYDVTLDGDNAPMAMGSGTRFTLA